MTQGKETAGGVGEQACFAGRSARCSRLQPRPDADRNGKKQPRDAGSANQHPHLPPIPPPPGWQPASHPSPHGLALPNKTAGSFHASSRMLQQEPYTAPAWAAGLKEVRQRQRWLAAPLFLSCDGPCRACPGELCLAFQRWSDLVEFTAGAGSDSAPPPRAAAHAHPPLGGAGAAPWLRAAHQAG